MTLNFDPFLPLSMLAPLALLALALAGLGLVNRQRGATVRLVALAALILALANPQLSREDREALSTVVPVIVDRSQSQQDIAERKAVTDQALQQVKDKLSRFPGIEPRFVEASPPANSDAPSTRLFEALSTAISDVPPTRVGGAIFITDGQVQDVPANGRVAGMDAPLHTLLTGKADEFDRRIDVVRAPRFGIVGQEQTMVLRVIDEGRSPGGNATITVRINGEERSRIQTRSGVETPYAFTVPRGGNNVLEFEVSGLPGEVSQTNNRAVHQIDGIRQNLRVLLVSGEPHNGERAWRNLLKSDASVDLVHFTILRPPDKQDGTPINELSLIAFPHRELFVDKINEFDLIIFDRYQHRGVLPILYYDYISEYVRKGGALLIAAGPEHAGEDSIALTPLADILPAAPTGNISEGAFFPRLSDIGRKHPVTRDLEGAASEPPRWGRWFRSIDVDQPQGETVMTATNGKPLLVLNRAGEGRVAMLLSDQGWLWARGVEGGGPHLALYRRMAHWLMKEPELEEEALTATASGRNLLVTRQTIGADPGPATITGPSGASQPLTLSETAPGRYTAERQMAETGLYTIANGGFTTLVHVGTVDAPEFKALISTPALMQPVSDQSKGIVARLETASGVNVPDIVTVRGPVRANDATRMALRMTDETVLRGVTTTPLFAGFVGLALLLFAVSAMWWREGR